ncbi:MAG: bifunctional folylpolyglutamate synthase/dihydrofolate synthase [Bacteroidales bacterium]|nr:bifunctional folylpolyglutamate synthase/dihydrofolate synthase [Bacteroidales bacterium]
MTYEQTIDYLYHAAPLFSNIGAGAYKEGLTTTHRLDEHFGHPHRRFRTIHVAGTNGKGSVSSTLAAILQSAGLKVGLYTSPHLVDFRERIRVNGEMIPKERVVDFVEEERAFFEPLQPSFFELTTALAFRYFAEEEVDVAVVEVGLGGRLDCTNIIRPDLCVITNISFDHQQFLGNTLPLIAAEKAGIIKAGVPVVVGETNGHADVRDVFVQTFTARNAGEEDGSGASGQKQGETSDKRQGTADVVLRFADEERKHQGTAAVALRFADEETFDAVDCQLKGEYQRANQATVQCAVDELRKQEYYRGRLTDEAVAKGFAHVCELTGLEGRWQQLRSAPVVVCDAGHNEAGITYVARQLEGEVSRLRRQGRGRLHLVFGMVGDKDYARAMELLSRLNPDYTLYYITQPSCKRALPAATLADTLRANGRACSVYPSVALAVRQAISHASADDFIFVGGSCYVVADLLADWAAVRG